MADRTGQCLGHYRLVHLLGQGGFARVYLAEHVRLDTQVAIKVLESSLTGDEVAKLYAEARTIARLDHPHIVRLLDFDVIEDTSFLVMSYAPGGTLRQRHPRGTMLPAEIVLTYLRQVAGALQYAHEQKVIHRDLKPENLLVGRREEILLSDFGIALLAHSSRSMTTEDVVGTVNYMAPEQLQGRPRRESDQYALAMIVYEWLTGSNPFAGTSAEIMAQHLHITPPPLREKLPAISPALEEVILKALAKDAKERFPSIQAFAAAFEHACLPMPQTIVFPSQPSTHLLIHAEEDQALADVAPTQPEQPPSRRGLSRRTLLIGAPLLTGLVGVAAGAGVTRQLIVPPRSAPDQTLVVYTGHTDQVRAVAWSPGSSRLASAGDFLDRTVQIWDAMTGAHPFVYRGYRSTISALCWSPDGTRVACGGGNVFFGGLSSVQVWDSTSGKLLISYKGHSLPISAVDWSPDGSLIASASVDKTVQVWTPDGGKPITTYTGHSSVVNAVKWSPNGTRLASGGNDRLAQVWDPYSGARILTLSHNSVVNSLGWSPDGTRLATGDGNVFFGDEHLVQIWDARTGEHVLTYRGHATAISSLCWSPDGKGIVSASHDKAVPVWDAATGNTLFIYHGHTLGITATAWSPNGQFIATASLDGTVRVFRV